MSDNGDDDGTCVIEARLGSLRLKVQGDDGEWVDETFDDKLDRFLDEAEEMSQAVRDGTRGHV